MRESDYLMKIERDRAKERQREHGDTAPGRLANTCGNVATSVEPGKTRDIVAEKIGMKPRTFDKARTTWEKANGQITKEFQNGSRKPPLWVRFEPLFFPVRGSP